MPSGAILRQRPPYTSRDLVLAELRHITDLSLLELRLLKQEARPAGIGIYTRCRSKPVDVLAQRQPVHYRLQNLAMVITPVQIRLKVH